MKKEAAITIFVLIGLIFISGCAPGTDSNTANNVQKTADGKIICSDIQCLASNFFSCTPAELKMANEGQTVTITVYGLETEKCHFTMVFGSVTAADCHFNQGDLTQKVFNQMFGNPEGQDAIIDEACKSP